MLEVITSLQDSSNSVFWYTNSIQRVVLQAWRMSYCIVWPFVRKKRIFWRFTWHTTYACDYNTILSELSLSTLNCALVPTQIYPSHLTPRTRSLYSANCRLSCCCISALCRYFSNSSSSTSKFMPLLNVPVSLRFVTAIGNTQETHEVPITACQFLQAPKS